MRVTGCNLSVARPYATCEYVMIGVVVIIARGISVFRMVLVYDHPVALATLWECARASGTIGRKSSTRVTGSP